MASIDSLEIQINASAKGTDEAINKLIENLERLEKALGGVNTKEFASNMEKITQALNKIDSYSAKASKGMSSVSNAANMITSALRSTVSATGSFLTSLFSIHKSGKSLASTFGSLYANFFWLRRLFQTGINAIGLASDLVEVQNVVDVTFKDMKGKVEDFANSAKNQFGLSRLSAKKFASQFQAMLTTAKIDPSGLEAANKRLAQSTNMVAKGYELASNDVADMSINLTKLAADIGSLYNEKDIGAVVNRLQSGIIGGLAKPMRVYGIDLTIATLQEYAFSKGLQQNVQDMTNAQKAMLRYEMVMERLSHVHGDFSKTANTWANQIKLLKMNFQELGTVVGGALIGAFKPAIIAINKAMNTLIKLVEKAMNAIGKLLGWQIEIQEVHAAADDLGESLDNLGGGGGGGSGGKLIDDAEDLADDLDDGADGADDLADALGDASKAAKKLKDYTLGIDELNIFRPEEADDLEDAAKAAKKIKDATDKAGSGSGGSGGGGGGGGGSDAAEVTGGEFRFEKYESDINSWYELGQRISDAIADGLESIDWTKIQQKAIAFSKNLADLLNGIVDNERMWKDIGHTLAYGFNTALIALDTFLINFHWAELGRGLGLMINQAVADFEWSLLGKTIADGLNAAVTYMYNLGVTLDFEALGAGLATAINKFFKTFDFKQLAEGLNVWIDNLEDAISGFFEKLDKDAIFAGLGEFFNNLQPDTVMAILAVPLFHFAIALGTKIGEQLVTHLVTGIVTKIVSIPIKVAEIGAAIATIFQAKAIPVIISWSTFAFELSGTPNLAVIVDPFLQRFEEEFAQKWPTAADIIGKAGAGAIIGGLAAAWIPVVGIPVGMIIGALVGAFTTEAFQPLLEKIKYVFSWEFLGDVWNSAQENFKRGGAWVILGAIEGMLVFVGGMAGTIVECVQGFFDMVWNAFKAVFGIGSPAKEMEPIGENILLGVIEGFTSKFDAFTSALNTWFAKYVVPWFTLEKWVTLASGIKSGIMAGWNLMVVNWKTSISNWWENDVLKWFKKDTWIELGDNIMEGLKSGINAKIESLKTTMKTVADEGVIGTLKSLLGISSPSKETEELGEYTIEGFLLPFQNFTGSFKIVAFAINVLNALAGQFTESAFTDIGKNAIESLVSSMQDNVSLITDFTGTLFETLTESITTHWLELKDVFLLGLLTELFTVFLPPYFSLEQWDILFTMLHELFVLKFDQFRTWWTTEAMTPWWTDDVMPWFTAEQWFPDVFDMVESHYKKAWEMFIAWWRQSMTDWWKDDLVPWFEYEKWYEQFQHIFKAAEKVFDEIKEIIRKKMKEAEEIVREVTEHMVAMIQEVIDKVHEAIEAINHLASLNAEFAGGFSVPGFAAGGFPSSGNLFVANEAGPELVGTINGNTAVASHGEITGIKDAVYQTASVETQLLTQIVDIAGAILAKDPVVLGDREIAMASNRGQELLGATFVS